MLIGKDYKIESDNLNVTLYRKVKEKGKRNPVSKQWTAIAYFSNIGNALDYLINLELNETELKDFNQVVERQNELHDLVKSLETDFKLASRVPDPLKV